MEEKWVDQRKQQHLPAARLRKKRRARGTCFVRSSLFSFEVAVSTEKSNHSFRGLRIYAIHPPGGRGRSNHLSSSTTTTTTTTTAATCLSHSCLSRAAPHPYPLLEWRPYLIESDMEAKLSNTRPHSHPQHKKVGVGYLKIRSKSKRGSGTVDQILQNAPEFCDVKIICNGKEVIEDHRIVESPTPSPSPRAIVSSSPRPTPPPQDLITHTFTCGCFKPKVVS